MLFFFECSDDRCHDNVPKEGIPRINCPTDPAVDEGASSCSRPLPSAEIGFEVPFCTAPCNKFVARVLVLFVSFQVPLSQRPPTGTLKNAASAAGTSGSTDNADAYRTKQTQYVSRLESQIKLYEEDILKLVRGVIGVLTPFYSVPVSNRGLAD